MTEFENDVAVVTGGTRGIGLEVSKKLVAGGATTVALFAHDDAAAADAETALDDGEGAFSVRQCDVRDATRVSDVFTEIKEQFGPPTILVNNAGVMRNSLLIRMDPADWQDVIETNLTGTFHCTRAASRFMLRGDGGRIVNVSSVAAKRGWAGQSNYAASKAGIEGFTRAIARELGDRSIRTNAVCPGYTDTELLDTVEESADVPVEQITTGDVAETSEIAEAILFLASEQSSYVNGEVLRVDGGLLS